MREGSESLPQRLADEIDAARDSYYRLVLLVGPARSGKTGILDKVGHDRSWVKLNLNLELSERLLDLTVKQRAIRIPTLLGEILKAAESDVILLDNVEMLFAEELSQDPLRMLQGLARNRTIVAAWPGGFRDDVLSYAEPGHAEFRKYLKPQAGIVLSSETTQVLMTAHPRERE